MVDSRQLGLMSISPELVVAQAKDGGLIARDMSSDDLAQVMAIENNAQASPWGRLSFEESLTKSHFCRVLEFFVENDQRLDSREPGLDGHVVAYHVVCPILDELHILNVVAAPQYQGIGLGHRLMHDILEIAKRHQSQRIFLEVRASNEKAQSLYLKWQFKQIGLRKEYYRPSASGSEREDALIFMRDFDQV